MPRTIDALPPEILRLIFLQVKRKAYKDRDGSFFNIILTCKRWSEIAIDVLWIDVSLWGWQLAKFTRSRSVNFDRIKSLTIKLPLCRSPNPKIRILDTDRDAFLPGSKLENVDEFGEDIGLLPGKIESMNNLESFSLTMLDSDGGRAIYAINITSLARILLALPQSVEHLELDTNGWDKVYWQDGLACPHLCPILRNMVGYMKTMRIRLSTICHELLDFTQIEANNGEPRTPCQEPRKVIISTVSDWSLPFYGCRLFVPGEDSDILFSPHEILEDLASSAVSTARQQGWQNDIELSLFDSRSFYVHPLSHDFFYYCINKQTILPERMLWKYPCEKAASGYARFMRLVDEGGNSANLCGSFRDLQNIAEGHAWVDTTDGYRLPWDYYHKQSRFTDSTLRDYSVLVLDYCALENFRTLFVDEQKEGHELLPVIPSNDFEIDPNLGVMMRGLTKLERRIINLFEEMGVPPASVMNFVFHRAQRRGIDAEALRQWWEIHRMGELPDESMAMTASGGHN